MKMIIISDFRGGL